MPGTAMFTSDKERLEELLAAIVKGKLQLPEFQRGWVWDDEHIRSLLASVSMSYPIGAVMVLETGNPDIRFKARPVEGVELLERTDPERFILDGQQRLTSLFQALCLGAPVVTQDGRGKAIERWYYMRMGDALDPSADREDAIVAVPADRKVRNFRNEVIEDYSTRDAEYEHDLFPLAHVFSCAEWRRDYNAHWQHSAEKTELFDRFEDDVIKRFEQYLVPVIELLRQSPKEAVCQVFEKVNTGGVSLSVFELVTASFAADEYDLRADWEGERDERGRKVEHGRVGRLREQKALGSVSATDFLQAVTLVATYTRKQDGAEAPVSCKRADVLKLPLDDYRALCEEVTEGFIEAAKFLFGQKVFSHQDLPYTTQVVPLAAILTVLGDRARNDAVRQLIGRWFWCGVFGELYGSAVETRMALDLTGVVSWIDGGNEPTTVSECNFAPSRLYTLRTRNSAAYKGLYALLIRDGGLDFMTGLPIDVQTYFDDRIDIHHIFPRNYCRENDIDKQMADSIINKTPLSAKTNRIVGGRAPSDYLRRLHQQTGIPEERLREIVASHVVDVDALLADDFEAFFAARREALVVRIEQATGKRILREAENGQEAEADRPELYLDDEEDAA